MGVLAVARAVAIGLAQRSATITAIASATESALLDVAGVVLVDVRRCAKVLVSQLALLDVAGVVKVLVRQLASATKDLMTKHGD